MTQKGHQETNRSLTIRNAVPEDCQNILSLFRNVFNIDCSEAHWKWEFLDNPANKLLAVVAEDNGQIVGQYAFLPNWMVVKGSKILGALGVDNMVHSDYRKSGLFVELAKTCIEKAASENVKLFYGLPNNQAFSGVVGKIGYQHIGTSPILAKILNPYPILMRKTKSAIVASALNRPVLFLLNALPLLKAKRNKQYATGSQVVILNKFDSRFDLLWERVCKGNLISLWKDSIYLNWRYVQRPETNYIIFAVIKGGIINCFVVLKIEEPKPPRRPYRTGYIVDFFCLPEQILDGELLIIESLQYLRDQNVDMVVSQSFEHCLSYKLFRNFGFLKYSEGDKLVVLNNSSHTDESDVLNLHNWQLMPGDSDTY